MEVEAEEQAMEEMVAMVETHEIHHLEMEVQDQTEQDMVLEEVVVEALKAVLVSEAQAETDIKVSYI